MVTHEELYLFATLLVAIIALFIDRINKKK